MLKRIFFLLCFVPVMLHAQNPVATLPQNNVVGDTSRQTDLIDIGKKIIHVKPRPNWVRQDRRVYFSLLPISTAEPGTNRGLVTSTTAGIYLGPDSTTNLSSATFAPYWNFKDRYGLPLRSSVWLPNNTWNFQGDMRMLFYPQYTWGVGSNHNNDQKTILDYRYFRLYESALMQFTSFFYGGLGYNLDYHMHVKSTDPTLDLHQFTGYNYGLNSNSISSGFSINLLYDTRTNSLNPLPGSYFNVIYRYNPKYFGSDETWRSLYIDYRKYLSMNPARPSQQNTLAFWTYLWTVFNDNAPYLDLPSINWDSYNRSGRGIDQNRYRGKTLFYFETEYRRDITNNGLLGFVVFSNINTVSGSGTLFTSWHPAAGTGLRIKFNKGSNTNIGIDYGFSKGYDTMIINLGEAF